MGDQQPEDQNEKRRRTELKMKIILTSASVAAAISQILKDWLS